MKSTFEVLQVEDLFAILSIKSKRKNAILQCLKANQVVYQKVVPALMQNLGPEELQGQIRVNDSDHIVVHHHELSDAPINFGACVAQQVLNRNFAGYGQVIAQMKFELNASELALMIVSLILRILRVEDDFEETVYHLD